MLSTLHTNQLLLIGIGHVPWVYTFREWFPFLIPSTAKFRAYATEMLNRRLTLKPTTPDLFSYLSQAENSDLPHFPIEWEARLVHRCREVTMHLPAQFSHTQAVAIAY